MAAVIHTCTEQDNIRWIINNTEGSVVTVLGDLINYFLRVKPSCYGHLMGSIGTNRFQ